jgi:hypothetical protein
VKQLLVKDILKKNKTDSLRRYFENFGDLIDVVIMTDKNTSILKFLLFR